MFRPPMDWAKEKSTNQSSFVCCVIVYHRVAVAGWDVWTRFCLRLLHPV